jgi:hypothetical protein
MRRLEARRMAAYRRGDPVELRTVYATGAAIGERDVARLAHLVGMRLQVRGLSARVLAVHLLAATSSTAQLRVVDALSSALITDAHGDRVAVTAARAPRAFDVTLRRERGVWRIYRLRPAGQRSSAPSAASTSS